MPRGARSSRRPDTRHPWVDCSGSGRSSSRPRGDLQATAICPRSRSSYEATIDSGALRDETDGSSDEARWVALEEVPTLPQVALVAQALNWL